MHARAKQPVVSVRDEITTSRLRELPPQEAIARWQNLGRLALTWHPIQHWNVSQVWGWCGTSLSEYQSRTRLFKSGQTEVALSGWTAHPAYVRGNERLSCAMCVLASRNDLINGARHNPDLYRELVQMEQKSGWKFRHDLALADLASYLDK